MTLIRISNSEDFLIFDTDITTKDISIIKNEWIDIRATHPEWDRMDCVGELLEERLPKYGLNGEFAWVSNTVELC